MVVLQPSPAKLQIIASRSEKHKKKKQKKKQQQSIRKAIFQALEYFRGCISISHVVKFELS